MTPTQLRRSLSLAGLKPSHAARLMGVNRSTMRRWLTGDRAIPEPTARLALLLAVGSPPDGVVAFLRALGAADDEKPLAAL